MKLGARGMYWFLAASAGLAATLIPDVTRADDLIVNGTTVTLHGRIAGYDSVQVINGGRIVVDRYAGGGPSHVGQGNLEIVAPYILVDATSSIDADGAGYRGRLCRDGEAPAGLPAVGGQGGCAVMDSGGGGGHFGGGGRGTKDISGPFVDPGSWEEDCGDALNGTSTACASVASCWNGDGLPTVAGQPFLHSIWKVEFGAAGGDKGCRDGDGWTDGPPHSPSCAAQPGWPFDFAGRGGGRIVLMGSGPNQSGQVVIHGTIRAMGWRGCGYRNDSAGGGAGGAVLLAGDSVTIGATARIWASGGVGGDTQGLDGNTHYALYRGQQCPACTQVGGTCDDCGGGGGGGIVSVLSRAAAEIAAGAEFDVSGSVGGSCAICSGEAGGGAGELQISGGWAGEICDGFDNDLDGLTDEIEDLGWITCGVGSCGAPAIPACENGAPNYCIPYDDPQCLEPDPGTRARFSLIVDTSGSMLTDLNGRYTFGDGSAGHPGYPGTADSRLFLAKNALGNVIAAYPEIDWSLARYYQDQGVDRSCQLAKWFECNDVCCTYDSPAGNSGPLACELDLGPGPLVPVYEISAGGEQCINYAGSCGSPGNGAQILVGFGASLNQLLMWIDHRETAFVDDTQVGDYCDFAGGGDCELRGTGPTPLADSLLTHRSYLEAVKATDPYAADDCRTYAVILLTDGAESCDGDPVAAAEGLLLELGVETYVIGFSVLPAEEESLHDIAGAGSVSGNRDAFLVGSEDELANALAAIVGDAVMYELCNGQDDDCDGLTDEDWPQLGGACTDDGLGICQGSGHWVCDGDGSGVVCLVTEPGLPADDEVCNGLDDDCDGLTDEGLDCDPCVPTGQDICDGLDNDCDGETDEDFSSTPCGFGAVGQCVPGNTACEDGQVICLGGQGPVNEECNGLDDDCDGITDGMLAACYPGGEIGCAAAGDPPVWTCAGQCQTGLAQCVDGNWGACLGATIPGTEFCNGLDDNCDGETDEIFPEQGVACGPAAVGVCEPGEWACEDGGLICAGAVFGSADEEDLPEFCNGLDDDCDGLTDEDALAVPCGTDLGICEAGTMNCHEVAPGIWEYECEGASAGTEEVCNLEDDDCDGLTDEWEDLPAGDPCSNSQTADPNEGECSEGIEICVNGEWVCSANEPMAEICDGKDNDCNGLTDDGQQPLDCPEGSLCIEGQCAEPCDSSELGCPGGKICEEIDGTWVCVSDVCNPSSPAALPCATNPWWCDAGYVPPCHCEAVPQACVDLCWDVTCPAGFVCVPQAGGQCLSPDAGCYVAGCGAGQICVGGQCVEDPCFEVECEEGWYCNGGGDCVEPCFAGQCPAGCYEGECVDDPCVGVLCAPGQSCEDGNCVIGDCWGVDCEFWEVCVGGECVEDPCWNIECPNGLMCVDGACYEYEPGGGDTDTDTGSDTGSDTATDTDSGTATGGDTATDDRPGLTNVLATGLGGCLCSGAPGSGGGGAGGWLALLAGVLLLGLRSLRGRGRALLALGGAALLAFGCQTDPYPFADGDGQGTDTGTDGDADGDADTDADGDGDGDADTDTDTGTEMDTCADVDTENSIYNCGECGNVCSYPHAYGHCVNGVCMMGACANFWWDENESDTDGCEYFCQPTALTDNCDGVDLQNPLNPYVGKDNDCDGETDEDVDFENDPLNCGWCGRVCKLPNAQALCEEGVCVPGQCNDGYYDVDTDSNHPGCEYECEFLQDEELCNNQDDDCDGQTDEGNPGGGAACYTLGSGCPAGPDSGCEGACTAGELQCVAGWVLCVGQVGPAIEQCDGLDNDCDGETDEGLLGTVQHCAGCGEPCAPVHATPSCNDGVCGIAACHFGWVDLDHGIYGCEYQCTASGFEICDGLDNDCDGLTDEDDPGLYVPGNFCRQQGACAGAGPVCREVCGQWGWFCDYDTDLVEVASPCNPNGVRLEETLCDGVDGDCDGLTDESFPLKGQPCLAVADPLHPYGICLSTGHFVCDGDDPGTVECLITQPGQPPKAEECNGVDDDCDGVVDNGEVDALVHVNHGPWDFHIYAYEASRVDAAADAHGVKKVRACSKPGVLPWNAVTRDQAAAACAAAGKRLCTGAEWQAACAGSAGLLYPYGATYAAQTCNGLDYGAADEIVPTGSLGGCESPVGALDLSGNLREWTDDEPEPDIFVVRGGSFNTPAIGLSCPFTMSRVAGDAVLPAVGFRCCVDP